MLAVYKKELRSYLTSMVGYVFIAFVLLILGIYFTAYNLQFASSDFGATLSSVTFLFLIITPILTMRILAEEKKKPYRPTPFNSACSCMEGCFRQIFKHGDNLCYTGCNQCVLPSDYGKIRYGILSYGYAAVLGFFFLGCAQIAVGLFLSSVTEKSGHCSSIDLWDFVLQYMMDGMKAFSQIRQSAPW